MEFLEQLREEVSERAGLRNFEVFQRAESELELQLQLINKVSIPGSTIAQRFALIRKFKSRPNGVAETKYFNLLLSYVKAKRMAHRAKNYYWDSSAMQRHNWTRIANKIRGEMSDVEFNEIDPEIWALSKQDYCIEFEHERKAAERCFVLLLERKKKGGYMLSSTFSIRDENGFPKWMGHLREGHN